MPTLRAAVFVVDDDASVREALGSLLRSAGFTVETFASAEEFLARPPADLPGCLVLDVGLPDLSGLGLQQRMAEMNREIPIVFITGHGDVPTSVRAMKAGAVEFLTKPFGERDLLDAIRQAIERDKIARQQHAELSELRRRYASLTPREREVLEWVVSGLLNKQIAAELGTREITVKVHRGKLRSESLPKPFGERDLLDAIRQAIERDKIARQQHAELSELRRRYASLTPREREVLEWVVSGLLNKQIAAELGTREITVKVHRGKLMRKMQAASL